MPWPPPGGLPPGEDPFEISEPEIRNPLFVPVLLGEPVPRPERWKLTTERAISLSIILHLLLILFVLVAPPSKPKPERPLSEQPDPLGLIKILSAPQREAPIPVQFFPAPGPRAKAPGKNPLPSDLNRVAHGGDPKLPRAAQPKAVPLPGIQDLEAGKRGEQPEASRGAIVRPLKTLSGLPESPLAALTAEQAAAAARSTGESGDEGGGFAHDGGFADSGPLSFDTAGYDWGSYASEMIRKIKRNWEIPALAQYGIKGRVTIRFFILKDGRVEGERILSSSGHPPFDNAAFQAIAHASPFKRLPDDLGHDREGITITFFYNLRPEEDGGPDDRAPKRPLLPKSSR